jgi:hypothetical protein
MAPEGRGLPDSDSRSVSVSRDDTDDTYDAGAGGAQKRAGGEPEPYECAEDGGEPG